MYICSSSCYVYDMFLYALLLHCILNFECGNKIKSNQIKSRLGQRLILVPDIFLYIIYHYLVALWATIGVLSPYM